MCFTCGLCQAKLEPSTSRRRLWPGLKKPKPGLSGQAVAGRNSHQCTFSCGKSRKVLTPKDAASRFCTSLFIFDNHNARRPISSPSLILNFLQPQNAYPPKEALHWDGNIACDWDRCWHDLQWCFLCSA
ncbi:hypothetical protein M378DRAFT_399943 [Amanita muscaria Koide BX008]|uniref:Uncharacterized protein n=1 Tax=Amanita muscaria (strain Koide BX008) TaxID=946122 RepID=A0A0C2WKF6_AMAMK|nr:hypothetical protein M378DRAFT_399943 [Amanita muscaria Koide BX008]